MHTFVTFHVLPDKIQEFESRHQELLRLICTQPGCTDVKVHRSLADPHEYVVYGTWESKDAWERAHQTTEAFKPLFKSLPVERHTLSRTSFFEPAYEIASSATRSTP